MFIFNWIVFKQIDMSTYEGIQLLVGILVILGSGVASWIGVKVALAEIRTRQDNHDEDFKEIRQKHNDDINELKRRIERLEQLYFK